MRAGSFSRWKAKAIENLLVVVSESERTMVRPAVCAGDCMRQYAPLRQHRVHARATASLAYRRVDYNPRPPGNQSIEKAVALKSRLINHASLRRVRKATRTGQTRRKRSASSRSFVSLSRASPTYSISFTDLSHSSFYSKL